MNARPHEGSIRRFDTMDWAQSNAIKIRALQRRLVEVLVQNDILNCSYGYIDVAELMTGCS